MISNRHYHRVSYGRQRYPDSAFGEEGNIPAVRLKLWSLVGATVKSACQQWLAGSNQVHNYKAGKYLGRSVISVDIICSSRFSGVPSDFWKPIIDRWICFRCSTLQRSELEGPCRRRRDQSAPKLDPKR